MSWQEHSDSAKGWLLTAERDALHEYASEVAHLSPLAEIGGYCGKSAIVLGDVAREHDTILFSIDWHRGSPEMAVGRECHHPEMMSDGLFDSLPHFRRNVHQSGLEEYVVAVVAASPIVGLWWQTPFAFLFIDGAHHDDGVMSDYTMWARHIVKDGLLAFHDVSIGGINQAAKRASREGFELVEQVETLRVLRAT